MSTLASARSRVTVQVKTQVPGATGTVTTWADVANGERWAAIVPLDAQARARFGGDTGEVTHRVILRGASDLKYGRHRVRFGARILELTEPPQVVNGDTVVIVREAR